MIAGKRAGFIPINLLLMSVLMLYFYPTKNSLPIFFADMGFAAMLTLLGTFIYLCTVKTTASTLFLLLMYQSAWIIVLLNAPSYLYAGIAMVLMSLAPNMLFAFFVHFTELPRKQLYERWNFWMLNAAAATMIALLTFQTLLKYVFFFHVIFGIAACIRISMHYRTRQRKTLNRERLLMNAAVGVSFGPFLLSYLTFRNVFPPEVRYFSIYMMIALPIAVGYILIKRSSLQTRYNYGFILKLTAIALGGTVVFVSAAYYGLGLSLADILLLLLIASLTVYAYLSAQKALSKRELQKLSRAKENLEKERLDILQKVTYDRYLNTLSGLIKQLIDRTISLDGTLIIWKEEEHRYILEQSGVFADFSLKRLDEVRLHERTDSVKIDGAAHLVFPLLYKNNLNGWMIVGHKSAGEKFTGSEVETLGLLADTVCELFKTTEILQENRRRYAYLPMLRYEDYKQVHVARGAEKIRKEMSLYLHDEVLQSILAVRHMCEAGGGVDPEIRELIIGTLDELNVSIRDKMFDVYPTTLQDLGLYPSLGILCRKLREEAVGQPGLEVRLNAETMLEVPEELEYTVFRTVKELLQNAIKHAEANEIVVSLDISAEGVLLGDVIDDGRGFDMEKQLRAPEEGRHIGLLSVKQEMNALGGELTVRKRTDSGMHLHFEIPLERTGEERAYYSG
ncbi:sensor histidine kinase [Saccharibacillus alkalitolerans]|uniref:Histidine kinase domain-containing protein n=1 Tax=Saccharibacillus alkalitolerans TaxID=2705290 RepID=A0ABX0FC15_9BACL|nr:ATP-binding protein [Saccharibacillus alkalitolerans]NGZ77499.1 hypothetical protein [Saccharibacillus alkalitolerans]